MPGTDQLFYKMKKDARKKKRDDEAQGGPGLFTSENNPNPKGNDRDKDGKKGEGKPF